MVHRVTVGWCHGGRCGGRMYYPKADYLEKVKAITSRLLGSRRERKIVKERIEGGANEKAVWRLFINCPFVCINFDFFWLNKARQLYMDF